MTGLEETGGIAAICAARGCTRVQYRHVHIDASASRTRYHDIDSECEQKATRGSVAFIVICVATIIEKREKVFPRAAPPFSNRGHSDREVIGCVSS